MSFTVAFHVRVFPELGIGLDLKMSAECWFFEITRLIEEFGDYKPKVLVLENAPNLMIGANGDWIEQILIKLQLMWLLGIKVKLCVS